MLNKTPGKLMLLSIRSLQGLRWDEGQSQVCKSEKIICSGGWQVDDLSVQELRANWCIAITLKLSLKVSVFIFLMYLSNINKIS